MFKLQKLVLVVGIAALLFSVSPLAFAEHGVDRFNVGQVLSDGKNGRVWRQWRQGIQNRGVQNVVVVLKKVNGGNDTSVNLRYGDGPTFDRQVYLTDNAIKRISFNVGGAAPHGQPLVLNAYRGEVQVSNIAVHYTGAGQQAHSGTHNRPQVHIGRKKKNHIPPGHRRPGRNVYTEQQPNSYRGDENDAVRRCRNLGRIRRPRIEISRVKQSGGLFSGKYRINGSIYGACIEEAGYFERGRLKNEVVIPLDDRYSRREFSFQVRPGRRGQIRVYTLDGREDIIDVDEVIRDEGEGGLF